MVWLLPDMGQVAIRCGPSLFSNIHYIMLIAILNKKAVGLVALLKEFLQACSVHINKCHECHKSVAFIQTCSGRLT